MTDASKGAGPASESPQKTRAELEAEKESRRAAALRREWREHLRDSAAWEDLSERFDIKFTDDGFEGPDTLSRDQGQRMLNLAGVVLGVYGFTVDGYLDPHLVAVVKEV